MVGKKWWEKRTENTLRSHHINMMNSNMYLFPKAKQAANSDFKGSQSLAFNRVNM